VDVIGRGAFSSVGITFSCCFCVAFSGFLVAAFLGGGIDCGSALSSALATDAGGNVVESAPHDHPLLFSLPFAPRVGSADEVAAEAEADEPASAGAAAGASLGSGDDMLDSRSTLPNRRSVLQVAKAGRGRLFAVGVMKRDYALLSIIRCALIINRTNALAAG
jgi:hypothetical protein